jgi:hypothetical protein
MVELKNTSILVGTRKYQILQICKKYLKNDIFEASSLSCPTAIAMTDTALDSAVDR